MALRILVADDSTTIQKVIKIAFAQYDLQVGIAASHVELLRELAQNKPDAMIVDALLPGMKGPESFKKLSDEWSVPMLILVGSYESIEEGPFRAAGFNNILRKPFGSADVVDAVGVALGRPVPLVGAAAPQIPTPGVALPPPPPPPPPGVSLPPPPTFNLAKPPLPPPSPFAISIADTDAGLAARDAVPPPPPPPPPRFDIGLATPPPPPQADESRRGRRAFDDEVTPVPTRSKPPMPIAPPVPPSPSMGRSSDVISDLTDAVLADVQASAYVPPPPPPLGVGMAMIPPPTASRTMTVPPVPVTPSVDELRVLVREAVEEYCSKHFPTVAREVITGEIRRLAEERARHLAE